MEGPVTHMIWAMWSLKKMYIGIQVRTAPILYSVGRKGERWKIERRRDERRKEAIMERESPQGLVAEA